MKHLDYFRQNYCSALIAFCLLAPQGFAQTRHEIDRFTLLGDRAIIERTLRAGPDSSEKMHFLSLELNVSSGVKQLVGDTKEATRSSLSSSEKSQEVLKLLNKNINSERFVEGHMAAAAPLPMIKHRSFRLLPSLFTTLNLASSFSFSAKEDPLNPKAQIYLKSEQKLGVYARFFWDPQREYDFSVYQMSRSDLYALRNNQDIVNQRALLDFDEKMIEEKSVMIDFRYHQKHRFQSYVFEIQELKIQTSADSEGDSEYRSRPLFHFQYWRHWQSAGVHWSMASGLHYRQRYSLLDGFYLSFEGDFKDRIPLSARATVSNQFLSLAPQLNLKYLTLYYQVSSPYRNPQDELWVSTMHKIGLMIPFP